MSQWIELAADDGHVLDAYGAGPDGAAQGGLVLIQEIFGVNAHIRGVADGFAAEGYRVLVPALFDRVEKKIELDYDADGFARGKELRAKIGWAAALCDIAAALAAPGGEAGTGKLGVVGYCWGGSLAFLAACRLTADCVVAYYGAQIIDFAGEKPRCPLMLHFGKTDASVPPEDVAAIRAAQPEAEIHIYPAGHGFNCEKRADYDAESSALARQRSLDFLKANLA